MTCSRFTEKTLAVGGHIVLLPKIRKTCSCGAGVKKRDGHPQLHRRFILNGNGHESEFVGLAIARDMDSMDSMDSQGVDALARDVYSRCMQRTQIYLEENQKQELEKLAQRKRTSMASEIREALAQYLGVERKAKIRLKDDPVFDLLGGAQAFRKGKKRRKTNYAGKHDSVVYGR